MRRKATRTANGQGSFHKRKDGTWQFSIREDGRRRSFYGRSQQDALDKHRRAVLSAGQHLETVSGYTVAEWLDKWLEGVKVKPRTRASYVLNCQGRIVPVLGATKLSDLTPAMLEKFYRELETMRVPRTKRSTDPGKEEKPLNYRTVDQARAVLSTALNAAIRAGLLRANPVASAPYDPPDGGTETYTVNILDESELKDLRRANEGNRWGPLWTFLAFTGLRLGEALALEWRAVDLKGDSVTVVATVGRVTGEGLKRGTPKTRLSKRTVPLPTPAKEALERQRVVSPPPKTPSRGPHLVFPAGNGGYQDPGGMSRSFSAAKQRAGLPPKVRIHDLRHTFGALLISKNTPPKVVQELMGHASITTTMDIYGHLYTGHTRAAVQVLNGSLDD
ncbi:MAG: tyrosine-type recombinase/integrase [Candidatus Dormibacteria bacterium]